MYYSIGEANYWYEVYGNGTPIVMFHGFTGSTGTWHQFVKDWGAGYQIILVDLPGHGQTETPIPRSMEECCHDLAQLFDMLGLDTFHLIGYSMGGRTALSYAMLYPKSVRSLILESASPGIQEKAERQERVAKDQQLAQRIEKNGLVSFVDFWQEIPLFHSQKRLPPNVQRQIRSERLSQSVEGLAQSLRYMGTGSQPSWWSMLQQFRQPVLLLVGELDDKFITINKKMQKEWESANLMICNDAGHAIHVEKPAKFGTLVKEFITYHEF